MRNLKQNEKELLINLFNSVKADMTVEEKAKHIWPEALKQCKTLVYATKKQSIAFLVDYAANQPTDEVDEAVEDLEVQLTAPVEPTTSDDKEESSVPFSTQRSSSFFTPRSTESMLCMYTVKDLADELGLTPYKARVALRKVFGKAKGRWQWFTEEEYQAALEAVGGAK